MKVVENNQKNHFTVITYTDQGLGHLRVATALESSAPIGKSPILYSSEEKFATFMHHITSSNFIFKKLLYYLQSSRFEKHYAWLYRQYLRIGLKTLEARIEDLFTLSTVRLDKIIFISTHFGLAHQLGMIKQKMASNRQCSIVLIVLVTDDSPQTPWYVPEADMTFVPSDTTKEALLKIAGKSEEEFKIVVNPYPINPILSNMLSTEDYKKRIKMAQKDTEDINVSIPVSGAAVGTEFDEKVITELGNSKYNFNFSIFSRERSFSKKYLGNIKNLKNVKVFSSIEDIDVVTKYDRQYLEEIFLLEITKPSEQAFKSLLHPKNVGGVLLLFKEPVGIQEWDNLFFLERHYMIPSKETQNMMFKKSLEGKPPSKTMLRKATHWRGLRLPHDPRHASKFILWCLRNNIFSEMVKGGNRPVKMDSHKHELGIDGAEKFWELIEEYYEGLS